MALVMLKKSRVGNFRRTVRDADGQDVVLNFSPGDPVDVPVGCLAGLKDDFYKTLFPVYPGPTGKPVIVLEEDFDLEAVLTAPDVAETVTTTEQLAPVEPINNTPAEEPARDKRQKR